MVGRGFSPGNEKVPNTLGLQALRYVPSPAEIARSDDQESLLPPNESGVSE